MTNIIATAAIALTNLLSTNTNEIYFTIRPEPPQHCVLDLTNCPVLKIGEFSFPKITEEQWNILTNYYQTTNMLIQFYAPNARKEIYR